MAKSTVKHHAKGFEPFGWLRNNPIAPMPHFVELTKDIAAGAALALQMVEDSDIAEGCGSVPFLNPNRRETFLRFAIASVHLLGAEAEREIEAMNQIAEGN